MIELKKLILIIFIVNTFFVSNKIFAQTNITNKGVTITNTSNNIYINGGIHNQGNGFFDNSGLISVAGSLINDANTSLCDSTKGDFLIKGNKDSISGITPIQFFKLTLSISDSLTLSQSIKVHDTLNIISGFIHLNGNTIDLDSTGYLANERDAAHICGATGKISATRQIINPTFDQNIAGLGLRIASNNNHGLTTIERSHDIQNAADSSVFRNFSIVPQNVSSIDSLRVSYFPDELYKTENNYKIFIKKQDGLSGWQNKGGSVQVNSPKFVTTKQPFVLDTIRITIADQVCAVSPDVYIGMDTIGGSLPPTIGTITCTNDTLSILAFSNAPNPLVSWRIMGDTTGTEYSNPMIVTIPGLYDVTIVNGENGCTNIKTINIAIDKVLPLLPSFVDSLFLNCSQTTVLLNDTNNYEGRSLVWNGDNAYSSSNPALVNLVGNYYRLVTKLINGCTKTDTVYVGYKPDLELIGSNDTLVCKSSPVPLSVSPIGNVTNINYTWSSGENGPQINVSTAETTSYVVTATTASNCTGIDTVVVYISPDIIDSVSTYVSCNGTEFGTVKIDANGGTPPLSYSITNGGTFFPANVFENIPYGTYPIIVKDSIGCTKSNTAFLNGFSNLPVAQFIASTSNRPGDTIVLVDISTPTHPDSIHWQFSPDIATIIGGDQYNPIIYVPDTATITITMIGFWGNCIIDTTKMVHFAEKDTISSKSISNMGIKSVKLYPNPNSGTFTVEVEFYKEQNSSIQVWDTRPYLYFQENFNSSDYLNVPITLPLTVSTGAYVLRVIGEHETRNVHFIISK